MGSCKVITFGILEIIDFLLIDIWFVLFPVRGTPNPGVNSFKKTMYFTEEVIDYSDVCYSNAMSYTIQWQEMSSK